VVFYGFGEDGIVLGGRKGRLWVGCVFLRVYLEAS
jgi:hypothetical protein